MSDIVEHLKECAKYSDEYPSDRDAFNGAAKEILRLREENARLREALIAAMVRERSAYLDCEHIVQCYDWEDDLEVTDMGGLLENMRHTIKAARDRAINDEQYNLLDEYYTKNAGTGNWWERVDLVAAIREGGSDD